MLALAKPMLAQRASPVDDREALELLERDSELQLLEAALDRAREGAGDLLLVEGPAGIGKSALLAAAGAMARAREISVLSARSTELEREFPFGAIRQLLEPPLRSASPALRGELLEGGAECAARVLGFAPAESPAAPEPGLATLNGLYRLVANAAEREPLLLTLDDAHWADPDSLRFLAFLSPRLVALRALLVVAARPEEWDTAALFASTSSDAASCPLVPAPLSLRAASQLVADRWGSSVDDELARACHSSTGGNPFFLGALIDELRRDGAAPSADIAARVRSLGPRAVAYAIVARMGRLPESAAPLARAVAVLGEGATLRQAAGLTDLAGEEIVLAADELARVSILAPGVPLRFSHPIIRNAVYGDIPRGERATLHRDAARLLTEEGAPLEQVAAQLLAVGPAAEPDIVETLRAAAADAIRRGAAESATAYLRRALAEPPPEGTRATVLVELGLAESVTDVPAAVEHLSQALSLTSDRIRRTLIAASLARTLFYADRLQDAVDVARRAVGWLDEGEVELRQRLQALILAAASMDSSLSDVADDLERNLRRAGIEGQGLGAKALMSALAHRDARACAPAFQAVLEAERALEGAVLLSDDNGRAAFAAAAMVLVFADSEAALPALSAGLKAATERGDLFAVAGNKIFLCLAHLLRGELADAVACGEDGLADSEAYEITTGLPWAGAFLAAAQMERGELDDAERTLGRASAWDRPPETANWHHFLASRAHLRTLRGDLRGGLEDTLDCGGRFAAVGGRNPAFIPWRSRAALCLTELGEDPERAQALVAEEVELARAWGAPRALGAALRAQGIVIGDAEGLGFLRDAVGMLEGSSARLELARALVDLGAAIRRAGKRAEAREPLKAGLGTARSCGAVPLVERAYDELAAAGARARKVVYTGSEALTPSERRVARLAAQGMTNREIAQSLFVTVKTVEFHLSQTYRKLDIDSRTQLRAALDADG